MRVHPRRTTSDEICLRASRLDAIPLRPLTARTASATLALDAEPEDLTANLDAEGTLDLSSSTRAGCWREAGLERPLIR